MSCRTPAVTCLALLSAGCDFCPTDPHVITGMRVLGTVNDPPVAAPGGAVTVRVVTADVADRPLQVAWYRCPRPLLLTTVATSGGILDGAEQVRPCLAQGEFARGTSVSVTVDPDGGMEDPIPYRPRRRWTDLVGFACAGGSIEPPPEGGLWPRCTGARGVAFTASIPGPARDGSSSVPSPAAISDVTIGAQGDARPWGDGVVPEVARCEGTRWTCPPLRVRFRVADSGAVLELRGIGTGALGAPDDSVVFVGSHVTATAPSGTDSCVSNDESMVLVPDGGGGRVAMSWIPPTEAGEVTFWFTARRYSGGLTVARRTVRVR